MQTPTRRWWLRRCLPLRRWRVRLAVSALPSKGEAPVPFAFAPFRVDFFFQMPQLVRIWIKRNGAAEMAAHFAGEPEALR